MGVIYFNQRGAGCGKTYESIQILNDKEKFLNKEKFIYLTKMHSVKDVISKELFEQEKRGLLEKIILKDKSSLYSNQYKITFFDKNKKKKITIIIGTIDSFNYSLKGESKELKMDYFDNLCELIQNDKKFNKEILYSNTKIKLNNKYLIIIDETQDLGIQYLDALKNIIIKTDIDLYLIGDKLQSIWFNDNIYTFIDNQINDTKEGEYNIKLEDKNIKIYKSKDKNKVMRFHNKKFINFVNNLIPFKDFNLCPIEDICDNKKCLYKHETTIPYKIITMPVFFTNDFNFKRMDNIINKIIKFMDYQIKKNNYLPKNFMFIFPILKNNNFSLILETRIENFWIDKFKDNEYKKNVLEKDDFWKDKLDNKYYKYIYLHKSDKGKTIDTNISENSTRILTIHTSKGMGREVVFVMGINEKSLTIFSGEKNNIIYNSLLHVALTRQKKFIYFFLTNNNDDDIYCRFKNSGLIKEKNIEISLDNIKQFINYSKIIKYLKSNDELYINIKNNLIDLEENKVIISKDLNTLEDWGHYKIRYGVFFFNLMSNIIKYEIDNESIFIKNQFIVILKKISECPIKLCEYKEYYEILENNKNSNYKIIPLLILDKNLKSKNYFYIETLLKIINNIKSILSNSLKSGNNLLPLLCPLQTIILIFMMKIYNNGIYSDISIMEIYTILNNYEYSFKELDIDKIKHSKTYKCLCNEIFNKKNNKKNINTNIKESISNHNININNVNSIYLKYNSYLKKNFKDEKFIYNIFHGVFLGENDNFKIRDEFIILGYSKNYVIYIFIKQNFTELNFNEIVFKCLFKNFILKNCNKDSNNYNKYNNKKIISCIMTLESLTPIIKIFNIDNDIYIKDIIKSYLIENYKQYHPLIYKYYLENKELLSNLPIYIYNFFKNKKKYNDEKSFITDIDKFLEKNVNKYLKIEN